MASNRGDVVHIALDCVRDEHRGGWRILVRGVFIDYTDAPPPVEGAKRNIVGAFLDIPSTGEPGAFFIGDSDG